MKIPLVAFAALALAGQALAARPLVGINDDRIRTSWKNEAAALAELRVDQVGVWVRPEGPWQWTIPAGVEVLATMVGGASDYDPAHYAAAARRFVLAHPNVRELQVWNESDLCWVPCAPQPANVDGVSQNRFYGPWFDRYLDLLSATKLALLGTNVKVLGFGMSPRLNGKWSPEAVAAGIARWRDRRGGHPPRAPGRGGGPGGRLALWR